MMKKTDLCRIQMRNKFKGSTAFRWSFSFSVYRQCDPLFQIGNFVGIAEPPAICGNKYVKPPVIPFYNKEYALFTLIIELWAVFANIRWNNCSQPLIFHVCSCHPPYTKPFQAVIISFFLPNPPFTPKNLLLTPVWLKKDALWCKVYL